MSMGKKCQNQKGNVIDPSDLIEEFGADALRFTLSSMSTPGRDIKLAKSRVQGYRNFITKFWNATRFAAMKDAVFQPLNADIKPKHILNKWICVEANILLEKYEQSIQNYRFDEVSEQVYHFVWNNFCDWYVEFAKALLQDSKYQEETQQVLGGICVFLLKILHPLIPFASEQIYQELVEEKGLLISALWPKKHHIEASDAKTTMDFIMGFVGAIRSVKASYAISNNHSCQVIIQNMHDEHKAMLQDHFSLISHMTKIDMPMFDVQKTDNVARTLLEEATLYVVLDGHVDMEAEVEKMQKKLQQLYKEFEQHDKKLHNEQFLAKAKESIVKDVREKHQDVHGKIVRLKEKSPCIRS